MPFKKMFITPGAKKGDEADVLLPYEHIFVDLRIPINPILRRQIWIGLSPKPVKMRIITECWMHYRVRLKTAAYGLPGLCSAPGMRVSRIVGEKYYVLQLEPGGKPTPYTNLWEVFLPKNREAGVIDNMV